MQRSPDVRPTQPAVSSPPMPRVAGCVRCVQRGRPACTCGAVADLASPLSVPYVHRGARPSHVNEGPAGGRPPRRPPAAGTPSSLSSVAVHPVRNRSQARPPGAHRRRRGSIRDILPPLRRRRGRVVSRILSVLPRTLVQCSAPICSCLAHEGGGRWPSQNDLASFLVRPGRVMVPGPLSTREA